MRNIVDLNCDMGEGFGHWVLGEAPDDQLMELISSANIAAGFHAGDPNSMDRVIKLANHYGVGLGAHPGYRDLQGFGRRYIDTTPEELVNDIIYQVGAVRGPVDVEHSGTDVVDAKQVPRAAGNRRGSQIGGRLEMGKHVFQKCKI